MTKAPKLRKEDGLIDWTMSGPGHPQPRPRHAALADRLHQLGHPGIRRPGLRSGSLFTRPGPSRGKLREVRAWSWSLRATLWWLPRATRPSGS